MRNLLISLTAALGLASASVFAEDISYDYVEAGIGTGITSSDGNGFSFRGSLRLDQTVLDGDSFIRGGFRHISTDEFDSSLATLEAGLRWELLFEEVGPTDIYTVLGLQKDFGDGDETSFAAGVGVRSLIAQDVEIFAEVRYEGAAEDEIQTIFGFLYAIDASWQVGLELSRLDNVFLKARYNFSPGY